MTRVLGLTLSKDVWEQTDSDIAFRISRVTKLPATLVDIIA